MILPGPSPSLQVLVLAPTYNDSTIAVEVLSDSNIYAKACFDLPELCSIIGEDCGAVIISEEALESANILILQNFLENQPPWSDIPIILLTSNKSIKAIELFSKSGNISLLERPFSRLTMVRSIEVALRARKKQYEVRDLLEALYNSKLEAERANVSKSQFLANMSHEIRTPIGAILGFTDLMKNPANTKSNNLNFMGVVERNSQQLLRLIDDILDLSKVEAGKMTIENIEFSLTSFLADLISVLNFKASEKGIKFNFNLRTLIPDVISSDLIRLRQILNNIAGNALKFTENGFVNMSIAYENPFLQIIVKDSGIGIPKEQVGHLFQPFSQVDPSTTRKFGGTGLGLVLSRGLAETLGGKLQLIESEKGAGSTFLIDIKSPLLPHAQMVDKISLTLHGLNDKAIVTNRKLTGLKVLLVEDTIDNQTLITTYLRNEGAEVKTAGDGAQGVELTLKENFDLLLMDIQMPVLDGHEATKKLRKCNFKKPIIALTAHAMREEQQKCFESGFTEFLTKPIRRDLLINVLAQYIPTGPTSTTDH